MLTRLRAWWCFRFHPRRLPVSGAWLCVRCCVRRPVAWRHEHEEER